MSSVIHTETVRGYTVEIHPDDYCSTPRDKEIDVGILAVNDRRVSGEETIDGEKYARLIARRDVVWLPVYLYDHSSYAIGTNQDGYPFSCPWDTSHIGIIYADYARIRDRLGVSRVTTKVRKQVTAIFRSELETWCQWLNGYCYGFVIKDNSGEMINSCYGFYGMDHCLEEARVSVPSEEVA